MGEEETTRTIPLNELDLKNMSTEPGWQTLSPSLKAKLVKQIGEVINEKTQEKEQIIQELSGVLAMYTRDIRLSKLNAWTGELEIVQKTFALAGDCLLFDLPEAGINIMNYGISITETSQAKGGFLRKIMNTVITKTSKDEDEPQGRSIFGGPKEE